MVVTGEDIKEGFAVQLLGDKGIEGRLYRIKRKEPFTYETGDSTAEFAALAAGAVGLFVNVEVIEPDDSPLRIAYVEWGVKDGMDYMLKLKPGTDRLGPDQDLDIGRLTNEKSPYHAPDPRWAFWLFHDWYPAIAAENLTPFTLTPKLWFEGYKFDVEEIAGTEKQEILNSKRYTKITLGGVG